ncbi:hypothetical protein FOZ63_009101, partial [Perkinsus olseni]
MTSSGATRLTRTSRNVSKRGSPTLSPGLSAELAALPTAKSGSLRRFAEYLAESRDDRQENIAGIVERLKSMERGELRLWDALAIAQSVATLKATPQDQRYFTYLPSLQYSWKPYERSIWDELSRRTSKFYNELHVDEVSDPVSFMHFLRLHKRLDKRFMSAMAAWARVAVYRPTSRTSRRPTARELALIVDYC